MQRAILLPPGQYVVFLAVKDERGGRSDQRQRSQSQRQERASVAAAGKIGVLRHEIEVPNISQARADDQQRHPGAAVEPAGRADADAAGSESVRVRPDARSCRLLTAGSEDRRAQVIFWIYGAQAAASGKPDVTIEYNFHQSGPTPRSTSTRRRRRQ